LAIGIESLIEPGIKWKFTCLSLCSKRAIRF